MLTRHSISGELPGTAESQNGFADGRMRRGPVLPTFSRGLHSVPGVSKRLANGEAVTGRFRFFTQQLEAPGEELAVCPVIWTCWQRLQLQLTSRELTVCNYLLTKSQVFGLFALTRWSWHFWVRWPPLLEPSFWPLRSRLPISTKPRSSPSEYHFHFFFRPRYLHFSKF